MRNDEIRTALEIANRYYASDVRAANQALLAYSRIEPSLRRLVGELEQFQNYTHYMLVKSFTFARGGWHDAPLMEASPEGVQDTVRELADVPDDEVKRKLDEEMSEYFREADCSTLKNMIDQWVLFPDWRSRVIDDAFEAHKRGKYTLSIPTRLRRIRGGVDRTTHNCERCQTYTSTPIDRRQGSPDGDVVLEASFRLHQVSVARARRIALTKV